MYLHTYVPVCIRIINPNFWYVLYKVTDNFALFKLKISFSKELAKYKTIV